MNSQTCEFHESMRSNIRNFLISTGDNWNYITPTDFYKKYFRKKNNYLLVDVRKKNEYDKYHINGAINIYWMDLLEKKNIDFLKKINDNGTPIFLICYVGHTSSQALVLLKLSGITNVISIKFGYGLSPTFGVPVAGWLQYRYPVVSNCRDM